LVAVYRRHTRVIGFAASIVSVISSALLLRFAAPGESFYEALMLLFSCLTAGATLVLPQRDCSRRTIGGVLFGLGSTLLAYWTENLLVFLAAWILSTVPFFLDGWFKARAWRPRVGLLLSSVAVALAISLIATDVRAVSIDALKGKSPAG